MMERRLYLKPQTTVVLISVGTRLLQNSLRFVEVDLNEEGDQTEAEARRWCNRLWDEDCGF